MIKIAHIITSLDMGGAERIAINIASSENPEFEYHIFEVVKGNSEFTEKLKDELRTKNISFYPGLFQSKKIAIVMFPFVFLFKCLKLNPHIIHSHTEIPDLSTYLYFLLFCGFNTSNIKLIRTIHNTRLWQDWEKIGNKVEQFFIRKKSRIAISQATKSSYQKKYFQEGLPIIYNGIKKSEAKIFEGLQRGKINILFAGRFEPQKGIDELCKVILALKDFDVYHFHIIGEGSFEPVIKERLKKCKNVSIYAKIYSLSDYFSSFDYLFMPSNYEGLASIAIEASLSKTPVIANSAPGLEETLPEDWLLKVSENSIKSYLKLFKTVIPNIDGKLMGEIAYKYSIQNFTIEKMQNDYEKHYKKVLNESQP